MRGACEAILVRGIVVLVRERRPPMVVHGVGRAFICLCLSAVDDSCDPGPSARSYPPRFKLLLTQPLPWGASADGADERGRLSFCAVLSDILVGWVAPAQGPMV